MSSVNILPTANPEWGFSGAIRQHVEHGEAWALVMHAIGEATGSPDTAVRDFLDSRHGRHFADDVVSALSSGLALKDSIHAAVSRWRGWRINRETMRALGIPQGLPYLTGFVAHFEVQSDTDD